MDTLGSQAHHPYVDPATSTDLVALGEEALSASAWEDARNAFATAAANETDDPRVEDGLGLALWWLRDVDGAIGHREAAYAGYRRLGQADAALRVAIWLATEYVEAIGNEPAGRGWLARAEGLLEDVSSDAAAGWLALTRGRLELDPGDALEDSEKAIAAGRRALDANLEAVGLAMSGLALVDRGNVEEGMARLDEAMAAATGGEVVDPVVFGDVCCLVTRAAEDAGDVSRLMRWNEVVMSFMERTGHPALLEFCGTCCAEVLVANGRLEDAEGWLVRTLRDLEGTGNRARCIHPAAKLAEVRLLQGRIEDATRLLEGYEDRRDALRAAARVHLARGETGIAAAIVLRRLNQVGDGLLAAPLLSLLVEIQLAQGDLDGAAGSSERLGEIAAASGQPRQLAVSDLAAGRVAAAAGEVDRAEHALTAAVDRATRLEMPLEAALARLDLAEVLRETDPDIAANEVRLALSAAEQAGATAIADRASTLARDLGGPARTGPKLVGQLTRREAEVLRLLGEGLSNAEIAARLFISTKTAGNHVSNVLAKLQLRNRSEAAAFAVRYLVDEPAPK